MSGVSVVLASDHRAGSDEAWEELRSCLRVFAAEEFGEPVEILVVETPELLAGMPDDVRAIAPGARFLAAPGPGAAELRNAGVREASGDLVAVLDSDCVPEPGWLCAAVETLRACWCARSACSSARGSIPGVAANRSACGASR